MARKEVTEGKGTKGLRDQAAGRVREEADQEGLTARSTGVFFVPEIVLSGEVTKAEQYHFA